MIGKWIAAVGLAALAISAGADDIGKQMTDPVSGKAVTVAKETAFVTVNGTRLYFVDVKSREAFLKAPETFLKAMVECPVRNLKVRANKANRVVVNDQIIYFCCANCPQAFAKEPNTYVSKLLD